MPDVILRYLTLPDPAAGGSMPAVVAGGGAEGFGSMLGAGQAWGASSAGVAAGGAGGGAGQAAGQGPALGAYPTLDSHAFMPQHVS